MGKSNFGFLHSIITNNWHRIMKKIKTIKDLKELITKLTKGKNFNSHEYSMLLANILGNIGNESLDKKKNQGTFKYLDGTPIEIWDTKENMHPFHIKDPSTGEFIPDPRVLYIGNLINSMGERSGEGYEYMYRVYTYTRKFHHNTLSTLERAWVGIGNWR